MINTRSLALSNVARSDDSGISEPVASDRDLVRVSVGSDLCAKMPISCNGKVAKILSFPSAMTLPSP